MIARSENLTGIASGQVPRQQTQRDGRKAGADERNHLRGEKAAIGPVGEDSEHDGSEQFGQRLDLGEVCLTAGAEAMVDVILNQGALGGRHGLLDGLELHGDVRTGPTFLDHADDMTQMAVRPLQPLDDAGMTCMPMEFCHTYSVSPWGG